jgi:arylsulfatase A-like enzyme
LTVVTLHGAVASTFVRLASAVEPPGGRRSPAVSPPGERPRGEAKDSRSLIAPGANVLLITVDALRADHLGTYGYARPTSPNIDLLATESVLFERAYTSAPHTSFALTSLLTGQPAMSLSQNDVLEGSPTLADVARVNGYHTAAFFTPAVFFVDGERFKTFEQRSFGFQSVFPDQFPESSSASLQTEQVLSFLAKQAPERFLAWIHYFAPHEPYLDHPEVSPPFGTTGLDRYDAEIRWTDLHLGRLVRSVRALYPDTIVVLTADHGEEFGEHGGAYHGTTLYDEQIRVPLIISVPGLEPRRIKSPVSTTSVLATVLDLTGIPARWEFDGVSLAPWIADASRAEGDLPVVFAENAGQRAAISGLDKLLCTRKPERCALFDVGSDAAELADTSLSRPEVFARLMSEMDGWVARVRARHRIDAWKVVADGAAALGERRAAARSLARSPERSREDDLRSAWTTEADPVVKSWLALALTDLGDVAARTSLAAVVPEAAATDPELGAHLALARARVKGTVAVPDLAAALRRATDVNLRCGLMHALAQWPTPLTGATLIGEYDVIRSRVCCAEALARLGDPSTVPFLLSRVIDEPYITVQTALVRALGRIRDPAAIPALQQLRSATPEVNLAEVVDLVLRDLAEPSGT